MIEFEKDYEFENKGVWKAHAKTYDHEGYGNGTGLEIRLSREGYGYIEPMLIDIRYTGIWTAEGIDEFVRQTLADRCHATAIW